MQHFGVGLFLAPLELVDRSAAAVLIIVESAIHRDAEFLDQGIVQVHMLDCIAFQDSPRDPNDAFHIQARIGNEILNAFTDHVQKVQFTTVDLLYSGGQQAGKKLPGAPGPVKVIE